MPWENPANQHIIQQARKLIKKEFSIHISAQILVCSRSELIKKCLIELQEQNINKKLVEKEKRRLKFIFGKYFKENNEIWLVEREGEVLDIVLHEFLHSIQECHTSKEGIVDYITFKLTNDLSWIDAYTLKNWLEIEKSVGYKNIKRKLISNEDCEEF